MDNHFEEQRARLDRKLKRGKKTAHESTTMATTTTTMSKRKTKQQQVSLKQKQLQEQQRQEEQLDEIIESFVPSQRFNILDASFGGGSHTEAILEAGEPFSRVAAMDCDGGGCQRRAELVLKKYGKSRFRFFPSYRFSQIQTVFGSRTFDAVILDPGPNFSQIDDPTRGFSLENPDDASLFDMRYSPRFRSSALEIVNRAEEAELFTVATELALFPAQLARIAARSIVRNRPFRGLGDVMGALQSRSSSMGEFAGDSWQSDMTHHYSFGNVAPVMRFLFALRAFVNHEPQELEEGLRAATEVLDYDGRLIVFTRLPFEKEIVQMFAENHPFALTSFEEKIPAAEAAEFSQPLVTCMHVLQRTERPCFDIKNVGLADDSYKAKEVREENHQRWLLALDGLGTSRGFPARNFGSEGSKPFRREVRRFERSMDPEKNSIAPLDRFERRLLPRK